MNKKRTPILDFIDGIFSNIDGVLFAIPYFILTSIGTIVKLFFLTLLSIFSFCQWIHLKELWNKNYFKRNLGNPWNFLISVMFFIILFFFV